MSLSHDGFSFTGLAGPFTFGDTDVPFQIDSCPGVNGISVMSDPAKGTPFSCPYTLSAYGTKALLSNAVAQIAAVKGRLTGTVLRDGSAGEQVPRSTFMGFQPSGPAFYSGGGTVGWVQRGTLTWIQRRL